MNGKPSNVHALGQGGSQVDVWHYTSCFYFEALINILPSKAFCKNIEIMLKN